MDKAVERIIKESNCLSFKINLFEIFPRKIPWIIPKEATRITGNHCLG